MRFSTYLRDPTETRYIDEGRTVTSSGPTTSSNTRAKSGAKTSVKTRTKTGAKASTRTGAGEKTHTMAKASANSGKEGRLGLRERKRLRTRNAILAAAQSLFTAHGIDGTAMDLIADQADISIASLYNYFPSKDVLLAEIIEEGIRDFTSTTDYLFRKKYTNAITGYVALSKCHFQWFDTVDRSWLRRFSAHALMRVDSASASYTSIETLLQAQVHRMTETLEAQGRLSGEKIKATMLSKLIWSIANAEFYAYVVDDSMQASDVCRNLTNYFRLVEPLR